MQHTAYISLGSNIGDRENFLRRALKMLDNNREITVEKISPFYETEPVGKKDQYWFLNAVCRISTALSPRQLLKVTQGIEKELGRVRLERWGPRTLDLDILLYDQLEMETPELTIPHPRIGERAFVLKPLKDLDNDIKICGDATAGSLLDQLQYSEKVLPWHR